MSELHWFSNFCPLFSVFDLERYIKAFGADSGLKRENLDELDLLHVSKWLERREGQWNKERKNHFIHMNRSLKGDFKIVFWGDRNFPASLRNLSCPPALLFYRGELPTADPAMVAVVGARNPTEIGRLWVQKEIPELAKKSIVIVSGGARGIDAEAHWAALEAGGKTIAFLPGSVDKPYPHGNQMIFERILSQGCLISEYPSGTAVRRENFHRRNRLIAGLAELVIIVEAAARSGTLMTANKALAENRDILVVPGPPLVESYTGSLELICQGAGLARDAKDIIFNVERRNVLKLKGETPTLWE